MTKEIKSRHIVPEKTGVDDGKIKHLSVNLTLGEFRKLKIHVATHDTTILAWLKQRIAEI